jgi:hypothetical protein
VKINRRLSIWVVASLCAFVLAVTAFIIVFGDAIVDGYGKKKAERAFAAAYPASVLRIGKLEYSAGANRLVAHSVTLSSTDAILKIDRISVIGVRWSGLFLGTAALADFLRKASLDVTSLDVEFPGSLYAIRCARLRASAAASELVAEGTELRTLAGDEEFFAAHKFRTTRFHVVVPECKISGLAYGELFRGKAYQARSVNFSRPSFDALVNLDKPAEPFARSPLMVNEALAAIPHPLKIDGLSITNGKLRYCERIVAGGDPGVLTFSAVNMFAEGIANRGEASAAVLFRAQGDLMDAGTVKMLMSIPITPGDLSLHYSGSLTAMDLTCLDPFLDVDALTRIKSGSVQEAAFEINVTTNHATGRVQGTYGNLEIALLDKQTGTEKGLDNRLATLMANVLKIRKSNARDASGSMREGEVNYTRRPDDEFQQFVWFALRTGVLDIISR